MSKYSITIECIDNGSRGVETIEAPDYETAKALVKIVLKGSSYRIVEAPDLEPLKDNVIYIDFKARKKAA